MNNACTACSRRLVPLFRARHRERVTGSAQNPYGRRRLEDAGVSACMATPTPCSADRARIRRRALRARLSEARIASASARPSGLAARAGARGHFEHMLRPRVRAEARQQNATTAGKAASWWWARGRAPRRPSSAPPPGGMPRSLTAATRAPFVRDPSPSCARRARRRAGYVSASARARSSLRGERDARPGRRKAHVPGGVIRYVITRRAPSRCGPAPAAAAIEHGLVREGGADGTESILEPWRLLRRGARRAVAAHLL